MFLERMKELKGVHDNKPLSNQVEHIVVDAVQNDDELVKDANCIFFKERPIEVV